MSRGQHRADPSPDEAKTSRGDTIDAGSLGEAWIRVADAIVEYGTASRYDDAPILEIERITLDIARPEPSDPIIERYANQERVAWMRANFTDPARVAELGDARSYASRLFDYAGSGRDQVDWVIGRLRADPTTRSAVITTFEPLSDTSYIPCVSMLDFWVRDGALELVVYAHSIDFGTKGYANLVELAGLLQTVATAAGLPPGPLVMVVKSAHVYDRDLEYVRGVLQANDAGALAANQASVPEQSVPVD